MSEESLQDDSQIPSTSEDKKQMQSPSEEPQKYNEPIKQELNLLKQKEIDVETAITANNQATYTSSHLLKS